LTRKPCRVAKLISARHVHIGPYCRPTAVVGNELLCP
jgi:hypothetical protein